MFVSLTNVKSMFDPMKADFSKVSPKEDLYCSHLIHAAKLDVNKKGIEGAAITMAVNRATSVGPGEEHRYFDFKVEKAFAFEILDKFGYPLFVGTVDKI